ncbi:MAG: M15 family metallopeptidase [Lachnospiraceae bacterium]|nr:M15 family metallopeptidase [Lachnospiraceae bacterium]
MKFTDNIWKSLGILALLIVLCSFFARTVFSSDTLADYAERNPEIAYSKSEPETETQLTDSDNLVSAVSGNTSISDNDVNTNTAIVDEYEGTATRIILTDGFLYEPIPQYIREKITGISYPEDAVISLDELSYVSVLYNDFSGDTQIGELICNNSIAQDLVEIFEELYRCGYQFEQIALIDEYGGDDTLSMEHNNTSCFNYRVVDGSTKLSKHAYGLAIDINPYYNPYVVFNKDGLGETYISPQGSEPYADRTAEFPYKIDENDLCYKLFIEHGFTWGGNWNSCKDYQHFQK